ncbi:geraniol 10-hydroxylase-like protein [Artemisia annua]|uniref:Geraniol 10-hydroxylase-like protein n=1 Tax=Artemisia annua TaxID=35608 RepID=A0A2U1KEK4_ARTAN|nr:geraniol 10-hydroxylase-like protein [Artemisia annua]
MAEPRQWHKQTIAKPKGARTHSILPTCQDLIHSDQDSGKEFKEVVWNIMELAGKPNLVDFFPVLKMIDPQGIRRRMTENFGKVFEIFEGLIKERIEMRKCKNGVQGEHDEILEILLNDSQQKHEEINLSLIKSLCLVCHFN